MQKLAACFLRLRTEFGFSIREASRQAGLSPSYLSKLESGKAFGAIGLETVIKLANAYRTPLLAVLQESGLVEAGEFRLPDLPQYLRLKYRMPHPAIRDMEMAQEIVLRKYGQSPSAGK